MKVISENTNIIFLNKNNQFTKKLENQIRVLQLQEEWIVVSEQENFEKLDLSDYGKLVVLAELKWGNSRYSDLSGLALIRKIRFKKGANNPIVLTSLLDLKQIQKIVSVKSVFKEIDEGNFVSLLNMEIETILTKLKFYNKEETFKRILNHFILKEKEFAMISGHEFHLYGDLEKLKIILQHNLQRIENKSTTIKNIKLKWCKIFSEIKLLETCYCLSCIEKKQSNDEINAFFQEVKWLNQKIEQAKLKENLEESIGIKFREIWNDARRFPLILEDYLNKKK